MEKLFMNEINDDYRIKYFKQKIEWDLALPFNSFVLLRIRENIQNLYKLIGEDAWNIYKDRLNSYFYGGRNVQEISQS